LIFLLYFYTHTTINYSANGKVQMFIEVVSIVFPFLTSIVTSCIMELEKESSNYKEMLGSSYGRVLPLLSKITVLLICGFCSLFLTIGLFTVGISFIDKTLAFKFNDLITVCFILLGCELFIYLLHIGINLIFNKGLSILIGVGESVLSAIMLTGLGGYIWIYVPSGFESRLIGYYLMKISNYSLYEGFASIVYKGSIDCIFYTIVIFFMLLLYFNHYEAKSNM